MPSKLADDPRIDPRIKAIAAMLPEIKPPRDVASREALVAEYNSPEADAREARLKFIGDAVDNETVAPSAGLATTTETFVSSPDGNTIKILFVRPDTDERLPCIYYIHGGGMATGSAFDGVYRGWGRILAARGVAVALVDFRNALRASSAPQIAPFPAGLNDCVSGLRWVQANADGLMIDPERIIVAGESGGGNLAIATALKLKQDGDLQRIKGLYALCPYIAGQWPLPENPSSAENEGIYLHLHNNRGAMAYGMEAFEAKNALAWPSFATAEDVQGFPPTVISVNECDPLRDEGVGFYRFLMKCGVPARCRQVMGTVHGADLIPFLCPEISRDTARHLTDFCMEAG